MLYMTGNIVKYQNAPYIYVELNEEENLTCLVRIQYSEYGWLYKLDTLEDIVFYPSDMDLKLLSDCSYEDEGMCVKLSKYFDKYHQTEIAKYAEKEAVEKLEDLEDQLITCDPAKITTVRKRWYKAKVDLEKASKKADAENKSLQLKLSALTKDYDKQLLDQIQQLETSFEDGTLVNWNTSEYLIFGTDEYLGKGFLLGPIEDGADLQDAHFYIVDKGDYFEETHQFIHAKEIENKLQKEIDAYIRVLRKKLRLMDDVAVYESLKEYNHERLHVAKDGELEPHRRVYDEMCANIEKANDSLGMLELDVADAEAEFDSAWKTWVEEKDF